jgi:hypothetical protein
MKIFELQFNLPTAQYPDPKKEQVDLKDGPIIIETDIVENFYGTLDGIVDPDAKNLTFEFVDLFGSIIGITF